jgi:DNA-binding MarR family transcriptional regulator
MPLPPARSRTARSRTPGSRYPASSAWEKFGFVLWHATLEWQRQVTAALKPLGLTHAQFVLLASTLWLEQRSGPPSQRELADHAGTDAMMTSQVVRVLERNGWIVRGDDPNDARVKRLHTTAAGAELARHTVAVVEAVDAEVCAGVDDPQRLLEALRTIARRDEQGRILE